LEIKGQKLFWSMPESEANNVIQMRSLQNTSTNTH
jgi:hypothetical protein